MATRRPFGQHISLRGPRLSGVVPKRRKPVRDLVPERPAKGPDLVPMRRPGAPYRPGGVHGWLKDLVRGHAGGGKGEQSAPDTSSGYADYPGDFAGVPAISYRPHPDSLADPGEVVWAWVPFEEDNRQGKDRPVLVIGRDRDRLLALPLTSMDHDRDAAQEAREGRYWMDVGTGGWDRRHRPSEVRLDRIVALDPIAVRRIGAALDRHRFDAVAAAVLRARHARSSGSPAPRTLP